MTSEHPTPGRSEKLRSLLASLYSPSDAASLQRWIEDHLNEVEVPAQKAAWTQEDAYLITYGDSIDGPGQSPLRALGAFVREYLSESISTVHLLPFYPSTSDGGFAVSDYHGVDPKMGDWSDIEALEEDKALMFDLVLNHASASHQDFTALLQGEESGRPLFFMAEPDLDLRAVVRPRTHPLLQTYETPEGPKHLWCTFSRDQIDWDFRNPEVLKKFIDIQTAYLKKGATTLRLDAVAYLWKEIGTSCIHLKQTHQVVRLLRLVAESIQPAARILTETNVPHRENISYFGDGDEAHMVYNFSLPPLVLQALLVGESKHLERLVNDTPPAPRGCTFFNFLASHDGIGLRPTEGILSEQERTDLIKLIESFGGHISYKSQPDGSKAPYEANISYFSALRGTAQGEDGWQVERFLCAHAICMALQGIPAIYINSFLAAPNWTEGVKAQHIPRAINRKKWQWEELQSRRQNQHDPMDRVMRGLHRLLLHRRQQSAFHPDASQEVTPVHPHLFSFRRVSPDGQQEIWCIHNLCAHTVSLDLSSRLPKGATDILDPDEPLQTESLSWRPYQIRWLELPVVPGQDTGRGAT